MMLAAFECPQAARSLQRYMAARSLAACSASTARPIRGSVLHVAEGSIPDVA
jgi:hypothetical protein